MPLSRLTGTAAQATTRQLNPGEENEMKHAGRIMLACLVMAVTAAPGQVNNGPQKDDSHHRVKESHANGEGRGQEVFNQNCSRCHNQPEGISPSISGTVAMHMRVRANLSEADYKALLRFLNP